MEVITLSKRPSFICEEYFSKSIGPKVFLGIPFKTSIKILIPLATLHALHNIQALSSILPVLGRQMYCGNLWSTCKLVVLLQIWQ